MTLEKTELREEFISDIRNIITSSRNATVRSVDMERVIDVLEIRRTNYS
jgi:hypothetical protein